MTALAPQVDADAAVRALVAADGNPRLAADNLNRTPQAPTGSTGQQAVTQESMLLAVAASPSHIAQLIRALRLRTILTVHTTTMLANMAAMKAIATTGQADGLEPYQATKTYTNLIGELSQLTDPHESHQTLDVHQYAWEEVPAQFREHILALRAASHQAPGLPAPTQQLPAPQGAPSSAQDNGLTTPEPGHDQPFGVGTGHGSGAIIDGTARELPPQGYDLISQLLDPNMLAGRDQ